MKILSIYFILNSQICKRYFVQHLCLLACMWWSGLGSRGKRALLAHKLEQNVETKSKSSLFHRSNKEMEQKMLLWQSISFLTCALSQLTVQREPFTVRLEGNTVGIFKIRAKLTHLLSKLTTILANRQQTSRFDKHKLQLNRP